MYCSHGVINASFAVRPSMGVPGSEGDRLRFLDLSKIPKLFALELLEMLGHPDLGDPGCTFTPTAAMASALRLGPEACRWGPRVEDLGDLTVRGIEAEVGDLLKPVWKLEALSAMLQPLGLTPGRIVSLMS